MRFAATIQTEASSLGMWVNGFTVMVTQHVYLLHYNFYLIFCYEANFHFKA